MKRTYGTEKGVVTIACELHFEATFIKQTHCSKKKILLPNALPKCREWNGSGRDLDNSSIRNSIDLLGNTTNIESESQIAVFKETSEKSEPAVNL